MFLTEVSIIIEFYHQLCDKKKIINWRKNSNVEKRKFESVQKNLEINQIHTYIVFFLLTFP